MNGIHIVACNNIIYNLYNKFPGLRQSRIKIQFAAIVHNPFRMLESDVVRSQRFIGILRNPERVQPCMKFHVPAVAFFNPELQRIVKRIRSLARSAGQVLRPWFKFRRIKSIRSRTDLHDDGIHPASLVQV